MAGAPTDRIPLHTAILPALGVAAWLLLGKAGLEPVALLLAAALLGNVVAAVHHAEVVAIRVGEPFGAIILALAVTTIEVGMIVSLMLSGEPKPALMRDSVHAVVMLVVHGLAGLSILVCALRHREAEFNVEGANAFLAVLIPMATLVLVVPNHVISAPGAHCTPLQLAFVSVACLALFSVVVLAKSLSPALEEGVGALGAPLAIAGVIVAAIVLLPETAAALRAAAADRLQSSINLALGSAVACIGLTVPTVAVVASWIGQPLELGISQGATVLMALGFLVAMITYGTGRTNLLSGIVQLVLLAAYVFYIFAP